MEIVRASEADMNRIEEIYEQIHNEEALKRNDLFVMTDEGKIVAAAILNQIQVPEYKYAAWKYQATDDAVMVIHTLVVDPLEKSRGYGKAFISFYEEYARRHNCRELRLDTNEKNTRARSLYRKLGYEEAGVVDCVFNGIPDVKLVCLEKHLDVAADE